MISKHWHPSLSAGNQMTRGDDEAEPEATPEPAADEFDPIKIMLRRKAAEKAAAGKPPEQTP